jgi:predicted nucleotidyltransferase
MAIKPIRAEYREVNYKEAHWDLLKEMRNKAIKTMNVLENSHLRTFVHGSLARGDVKKTSDIDIIIMEPPSSFIVETAIERAHLPIKSRFLVQATPNYAMKAHIEISMNTSISFPLMHMRKVEREFYTFGGKLNLTQLKEGIRIAGVDKRLMLIEPSPKGHTESSILGCEKGVARQLGISAETVLDRVHTLKKRDKIGRTGVFIKKELNFDETFEMVLKRLANKNPAVRRRMRID